MSNVIATKTTVEEVGQKCKDKGFIEDQVIEFTKGADSAIRGIIAMSKTVALLHQKYKSNEINHSDIEYFCMKVNLNPKGSQYRKFICIGNKAEKFEKYIDAMPQTISVLYEITTLSAETFENLIEKQAIKPDLTLTQLKRLVAKPKAQKNNSAPVQDSITLNFNFSDLSDASRQIIVSAYQKIKSCNEISMVNVDCEPLVNYMKSLNESNVIDVTPNTAAVEMA
jgi:hypothetical protein